MAQKLNLDRKLVRNIFLFILKTVKKEYKKLEKTIKFMSYRKPLIGIIGGKGKMGSWFENFFVSQGLPVIISDKETEFSNIELAKKADIVIVSVPISETTKVIKEIRNYLKSSAFLSDITSLKMRPVEEMKKAKCEVLGMHPLFGPLVQKLEG